MSGFDLPQWVQAVLWSVLAASLGALIGLIIDRVVVGRLGRAAKVRGWHLRHALVASLGGMPEIWGALFGLSIVRADRYLPGQWAIWSHRAWVVALVLSLTVFASRMATAFIRSYTRTSDEGGSSATIFVNIARVSIWALGLTTALGALGVQIGPLVATLGVGGIAISLGLQDTLANLFNGLQITLSHQIEAGQFVRLQTGEEGEVLDVNWRDTRLRTPSGDVVIVPNSVIGRSVMTNYSRGREEHITQVAFAVPATADLARGIDIANRTAAATQTSSPEADSEFEPVCRVSSITSDSATCSVGLRVISYRKRAAVADEFLQALHQALAAEGVAFGEPA